MPLRDWDLDFLLLDTDPKRDLRVVSGVFMAQPWEVRLGGALNRA